jgi:hypothetical protein
MGKNQQKEPWRSSQQLHENQENMVLHEEREEIMYVFG